MAAPMTDAWEALETRDPDILQQVYRLRVEAWRARNPDFPALERWNDSFDASGRHWVIVDHGRPVAAARLTVHSALAEVPNAEIYRDLLPEDLAGPIGVLTRLVVARSHAGRGLSRSLDLARIDAAREVGCRHLIGETFAGLPRIQQMCDLGFSVIGKAGSYADGPLATVKSTDARDTKAPAVIRLALKREEPLVI